MTVVSFWYPNGFQRTEYLYNEPLQRMKIILLSLNQILDVLFRLVNWEKNCLGKVKFSSNTQRGLMYYFSYREGLSNAPKT